MTLTLTIVVDLGDCFFVKMVFLSVEITTASDSPRTIRSFGMVEVPPRFTLAEAFEKLSSGVLSAGDNFILNEELKSLESIGEFDLSYAIRVNCLITGNGLPQHSLCYDRFRITQLKYIYLYFIERKWRKMIIKNDW